MEKVEKIEKKLQKLKEEVFIVSINYSKSLKELMLRGCYDWVNGGINERNFVLPAHLINQRVLVSSKLFNFNRLLSSEEAIYEMRKKGYRPATIFELLALGSKYKWLQRYFPIIALGSTWNLAIDVVKVPYLTATTNSRKLHLNSFQVKWPKKCYFLGVSIN